MKKWFPRNIFRFPIVVFVFCRLATAAHSQEKITSASDIYLSVLLPKSIINLDEVVLTGYFSNASKE